MISSGVPHGDEVRWLPQACSEAPMEANLGAELGRGGDRLRFGSNIFLLSSPQSLLDFEIFLFKVGRTIFGIAFDAGIFGGVAIVVVFVTVGGALDDEAVVEYAPTSAARRAASDSFRKRSVSMRSRALAKCSSKFFWYNASAS